MNKTKRLLTAAMIAGGVAMAPMSADAFWWPGSGGWGGPWGGYPYYGGYPAWGAPIYGAYSAYGYPTYGHPYATVPQATTSSSEKE